VETEKEVSAASYKVSVELTPLEAATIAVELFNLASSRLMHMANHGNDNEKQQAIEINK
jgi:hypothetical protein